MKIKHNPDLKEFPHINYKELNELQGNLKELSGENYSRMLNSLEAEGLLSPFAVWFNPNEENRTYILDGHQRKTVMVGEKIQPLKVPYYKVPGKNLEEAKKALMGIASQFGTVTKKGLEDFTLNIDKEYLKDNTYFDNASEFYIELDEESPKDEEKKRSKKMEDGYVLFELTMETMNQIELNRMINTVKLAEGFEKQEEALMHIITHYGNSIKKRED